MSGPGLVSALPRGEEAAGAGGRGIGTRDGRGGLGGRGLGLGGRAAWAVWVWAGGAWAVWAAIRAWARSRRSASTADR